MQDDRPPSGDVALLLVEALLIHLCRRGILKDDDREDVFCAAIEAHREALKLSSDPKHASMIDVLERLRADHDMIWFEEQRRRGGAAVSEPAAPETPAPDSSKTGTP